LEREETHALCKHKACGEGMKKGHPQGGPIKFNSIKLASQPML
jgi:hypothetical protein